MTAGKVGLSTLLRDCVGGKTASAFEKSFGMVTVLDLLMHVPRRYSKRGELTDLSNLRTGDQVTVLARVKSVTGRRTANRKHMLEVIVSDGRSNLSLTFFNQAWREREMTSGRLGLFAGKVGEFRGKLQLSHPEYEFLDDDADPDSLGKWAAEIIPVYPASAAVASWKTAKAVALVIDQIDWATQPDPLPAELCRRYKLPPMGAAFTALHTPSSISEAYEGRRRLKWHEALALQTVLAVRRDNLSGAAATVRPGRKDGLLARFDSRLPFQMTDGQREVSQVILDDLQSGHPMHRLLQGEVGSGKTLVALRAMLAVVDSGGQAALLAPTEVLAAQHLRTITELMGPLAAGGMLGGDGSGTQIALLTGSQTVGQRREALLKVVSGEAGIVVGTHAILQDKVQFADLGLIVVDEQHRFGVEQRAALSVKTNADVRAHVLVMTATPIPRTVAMTVFGDLEVSTLSELPGGRSPIQTHVVPAVDKPTFVVRMWERVREEVQAGGQAYVVCPRIDQDPDSELEAALAEFVAVDDEGDPYVLGGDESSAAPLA
ncbi:MAG: DEAD/DEAH box helicase, partial [Actinomycetes bacterium]